MSLVPAPSSSTPIIHYPFSLPISTSTTPPSSPPSPSPPPPPPPPPPPQPFRQPPRKFSTSTSASTPTRRKQRCIVHSSSISSASASPPHNNNNNHNNKNNTSTKTTTNSTSSSNSSSTPHSPSLSPPYEVLPAHVRHNARQARTIAFHVSARRVLRAHSYAHALRATRRLISSVPALRLALKRLVCSGVHPSFSSLSSSTAASDNVPPSLNQQQQKNGTCGEGGATHVPRRVDGLQASLHALPHVKYQSTRKKKKSDIHDDDNDSDDEDNCSPSAFKSHFKFKKMADWNYNASTRRRPRRTKSAREHEHTSFNGKKHTQHQDEKEVEREHIRNRVDIQRQLELQDLSSCIDTTETTLLACRARAHRAMSGIPAAHDVFVLLSVFLALPTTPIQTTTSTNSTCTAANRQHQQQQQQLLQQGRRSLPRRASAPSLGIRPDNHYVNSNRQQQQQYGKDPKRKTKLGLAKEAAKQFQQQWQQRRPNVTSTMA